MYAASDLAGLTWPEIGRRAAGCLLVLPLGSTEQHGPHLPLSTDTDIALELARRLAAVRPDVLIAPAVPYGSSGEHAGFPGTLSIGQSALENLVVELARSADAFAAVLIVSAHGGNALPLARAVSTLRAEGRAVRSWTPTDHRVGDRSTDAHAGYGETSVMLAIRPSSVRGGDLPAGRTEPVAALMDELVRSGVSSVSPNGVLGDARGANASSGESLLEAWAGDLARSVQGWP